MKVKCYMRHYQMLEEKTDKKIYYDGTNPSDLSIQYGEVPQTKWIDFTEDIENLNKLSSRWSKSQDSNDSKGTSGELILTEKAYNFVKDWIIDHVAGVLNAVEVRIEIDNFVLSENIIKSEGIKHCTDDYCELEVNLVEKKETYDCIQRTLITDNHAGMFDGNYQHPRFAYCNEFRPAFLLGVVFSILGLIASILFIILVPVFLFLDIIKIIVNVILETFKAIVRMLNAVTFGVFDLDETADRIDDLQYEINKLPGLKTIGVLRNLIIDLFVDLAGCGREHPAPLLRDYISNVCSKCSTNVHSASFPILFDSNSPYYNACMLSAETKKGIDKENKTNFWIPDNAPLYTLDMLLDKLKVPFNAEWKIRNNTLYFNRHDKFDNEEFIFDFIGKDRAKLIESVCFTWSLDKKHAYARAGYSLDGFDNVGVDAKRRYNDLVEFNKPINPTFKGEKQILLNEFAPTRFRTDGVTSDYVYDAFKIVNIFEFIAFPIKAVTDPAENILKKYKGAILMQNHTLMMNKLLIWDGQSKTNARVKYIYEYGGLMPEPNLRYNPTGQSYHSFHNEDITFEDGQRTKLYNYDFCFEANFKSNIWDRFHEIDDPRLANYRNQKFSLKIALCEEDLRRLELENAGENIAIGRKVKLNAGRYYQDGRITDIEINLDDTDKLGRYIELKGKV